MEMEKKKTAMPLIAGILSICHGSIGFLILLGLIIAILVVPTQRATFSPMWQNTYAPVAVLVGIAIPCAIVSIVSMVGGIYAVIRRNWGLALAGSIAALIPTLVLGIPAVILIALSKDEFE